jgi:hypothetical protein
MSAHVMPGGQHEPQLVGRSHDQQLQLAQRLVRARFVHVIDHQPQLVIQRRQIFNSRSTSAQPSRSGAAVTARTSASPGPSGAAPRSPPARTAVDHGRRARPAPTRRCPPRPIR